MSLSKILEQILVVKPLATEEVEQFPLETYAGRRGRQSQAVENLRRLKREYFRTLITSGVYILVIGEEEKQKEFSKLAVENHKCFSTDPAEFYNDLAKRVPSELYLGKEGLVNTFDILGRHLEDKAMELDIVGYPQLIFKQEYRRTITTKEEFLALVKDAVNDQVGGELVGIQAAKSLTDEAIERKHAARVTPILLPTTDEKFALTVAAALERLSHKVFVVNLGRQTKAIKAYGEALAVKEITPETVQATLETISTTLKK